MPELRSRTVTHGRNMAGARALLRAAGVAREDFGKPIVAVANSYTQFVPGHHLQISSAQELPDLRAFAADPADPAGAVRRRDDGLIAELARTR